MSDKIKKEFLHHLRDTIILLGGTTKIADMLKRLDNLTESDVLDLRRLNGNLIDSTKYKLANMNTTKIIVNEPSN